VPASGASRVKLGCDRNEETAVVASVRQKQVDKPVQEQYCYAEQSPDFLGAHQEPET